MNEISAPSPKVYYYNSNSFKLYAGLVNSLEHISKFYSSLI